MLQRSHSEAESVAAYQALIKLLPPTSRYLLLYLLDFLSVFVRNADSNLMTASNLAVVFQPGLVSTRNEGAGGGALLGFPGFDAQGKRTRPTVPAQSSVAGAQAMEGAGEHGKGKEVVEFLIEQQAHFMLNLEPPDKSEAVEMVAQGIGRDKPRDGAAGDDSGYGQSGSASSTAGPVKARPTASGAGSITVQRRSTEAASSE